MSGLTNLHSEIKKAYETKIRTRFCESDALGHINNVSFIIYIEQARVDFMLENEIESSIKDWSYLLASVTCDFKKQLFINEEIIIRTSISKIGTSSFTLRHHIHRVEDEAIVAEANSVLVCYDKRKEKSMALDQEVIKKLNFFLI